MYSVVSILLLLDYDTLLFISERTVLLVVKLKEYILNKFISTFI